MVVVLTGIKSGLMVHYKFLMSKVGRITGRGARRLARSKHAYRHANKIVAIEK